MQTTSEAARAARDGGEVRAGRSDAHPERYGLLLASTLAAFLLEGIGSDRPWVEVLQTSLLVTSVLTALWAADIRRGRIRLAAVLGVLVLAVAVLDAASGRAAGGATVVANAMFVLIAPPAIVLGVLRALRRHEGVTVQIVFGVLSLYLLIGLLFAFLYGALAKLGGAPFFAGGAAATQAHYLYYSFTTLTTVGYGDLTARTNLGHTLSVLEALLGQLYLVTVVSVIVTNLRRRVT
jgi:hypothetical protein